jgi:hypothetical protein
LLKRQLSRKSPEDARRLERALTYIEERRCLDFSKRVYPKCTFEMV